MIPQRIVTLAFVSSVNAASVRAVRYAMSLEAAETRAIFFQLDPEDTSGIQEAWFDARLAGGPPGHRGGAVPRHDHADPGGDPTVHEPAGYGRERRDPRVGPTATWHLLLHNQTALFVKRLLLFEERAILTSVPYALRGSGWMEPGDADIEGTVRAGRGI